MKVSIINTNKVGEIVGYEIVLDQFGSKFEKPIVRVLKHLGSKKTFTRDTDVDYTITVNPSFINNL